MTLISEAYNVQPEDRVLVHTVAGGMGLCLAQLISARGATVIGTTSTPEKAEIAKAHGASHVILYKQEDAVKRVLELTDGKGVNAIYDAVGKDTSVHVPSTPSRIVDLGFFFLQVRGRPEDDQEERHHCGLWHYLGALATLRSAQVR